MQSNLTFKLLKFLFRKNLFLSLIMVFGVVYVNAQFGVSAGLLYGTDSELGFTGRVNYDLNEKISIYAGYSALSTDSEETIFGKISSRLSSIDLNGHYYFLTGNTKPYALAGLSFISARVSIL